MDEKEFISRRVARELKNGQIVNLGIGLPTMVANYLPKDVNIVLQSENGIMGMGPEPAPGKEDKNITNAGGKFVTAAAGACFFDSSVSFSIIRGGHLEVTVLGALEVDSEGNLSSHIIPGKLVPGMGGAMDLVAGAKRVIVATTHTAKGKPKILKKCTLPLTAAKKVNLIVTELAVIEVTENGLLLREIARDTTLDQVKALTGAELMVAEDLKLIEV